MSRVRVPKDSLRDNLVLAADEIIRLRTERHAAAAVGQAEFVWMAAVGALAGLLRQRLARWWARVRR